MRKNITLTLRETQTEYRYFDDDGPHIVGTADEVPKGCAAEKYTIEKAPARYRMSVADFIANAVKL